MCLSRRTPEDGVKHAATPKYLSVCMCMYQWMLNFLAMDHKGSTWLDVNVMLCMSSDWPASRRIVGTVGGSMNELRCITNIHQPHPNLSKHPAWDPTTPPPFSLAWASAKDVRGSSACSNKGVLNQGFARP